MSQQIKSTIQELEGAAALLDRERVGELCATLIALLHESEDRLPVQDAKGVLNLLRRKRFFGPMQRVADALVQVGEAAPAVRCLDRRSPAQMRRRPTQTR